MSQLILSRSCLRCVFFFERYLLSALFLFLGYEYLDTLRLMHLFAGAGRLLPQAMVARDGGFLDGIHFEDFARYLLLAAGNLMCGGLLLVARRPSRFPTRAREVVVPLLATFFYSIFNQHVPLPLWMTTPFVPAAWSPVLAGAGLGASLVGAVGSLLCILMLGRSLGIVVSVREVILTGPYRYVRHPIYLSYFALFAGLFLTACTVRMLMLVLGGAVVLCWRARLEEGVLSAHSPAYRAWMAHTGFLWPRWRSEPALVRRIAAPGTEESLLGVAELAESVR